MSESKYYGSGIVWSCKHSPSGQCNSKACDPWGRNCVLGKSKEAGSAFTPPPTIDRRTE